MMTKTREHIVRNSTSLQRFFWLFLVLGLLAPDAPAMGKAEGTPSLLVVPARYTTLQLAFDVLAKRNIVLVTYETGVGRSAPVLHVWDGLEWIPISADDYTTFGFLKSPPGNVVLIGDDATLPSFLIDGAMTASAGNPMQIPHQDTASILNALGKIYGFSVKEWVWFAARYRLQFEDANALRRKTSWYDGAYIERPDDSDLQGGSPRPVSGDGPLSPAPVEELGEEVVAPAYAPSPVTVIAPESLESPEPVPVEFTPPRPSFDAPIK